MAVETVNWRRRHFPFNAAQIVNIVGEIGPLFAMFLVNGVYGIAAGTWMFIAANLTPNFPLAIGGYTFPGYSALYTVILNLVVTVVLTPLFNAIVGRVHDDTVVADYYA